MLACCLTHEKSFSKKLDQALIRLLFNFSEHLPSLFKILLQGEQGLLDIIAQKLVYFSLLFKRGLCDPQDSLPTHRIWTADFLPASPCENLQNR